ncbi:MAG: ABC transporter substrate-binding protein [Planctomycetes bacterium]|nr:ABC transporter substrate-binding protein [Planctomycetota bacterium]
MGARRIVSLCPSLTELVFDLGLGADLVGITNYCVHPRGLVDAVEKVGGTKDPNVARIVELAPDVVLVNEEENRREDAEALGTAGIRVANSFPKDSLETATMVRDFGRVLGVEAAAETIALDIEARTRAVRARARERSTTRSFAYLIWRKPWMSVNAETFASALLCQAGGRNVFAEREPRYLSFDVAELAAAAPERVLLCTEPFPFQHKHIVELAAATGLDEACFRIVDGEYLSWHGSRTPDGVDYAESALWD